MIAMVRLAAWPSGPVVNSANHDALYRMMLSKHRLRTLTRRKLLASAGTATTWFGSSIGVVCRYLYRVHQGKTALTHLPLDKMAAISQTVFSDAFL